MQIANIFPIENQEHYQQESYVMILAHLLNHYNPENFNDEQYIIMDNGLYEKAQVSTDLEKLVEMAEASPIPIKEIIIPDVANDAAGTVDLFMENLETIRKWSHKYCFMFVAQAKSYLTLFGQFQFIHQQAFQHQLNVSIGVSKLTPLDRAAKRAIEIYKESWIPIHFLGIKETFKELRKVKKYIRGCDTSQLAYIAKNYTVGVKKNRSEWQTATLEKCVRKQNASELDIDLLNDVCSNTSLRRLLEQEKEYKKKNGIL